MQSINYLNYNMERHNTYVIQKITEFINMMGLSVGDYKWSCKETDFCGWLICDGRSLNREDYPDLFNVIGTTFGSDDCDTFKLPDLRGRVMAAIGSGSNLTARDIGDMTGAEMHTLSVGELPSHNHTGTTGSSGDHTHTTNATGGQGGLGLAAANGANTVIDVDSSLGELNVWSTPQALTVNTAGAHTHTFTTNSTGSGNAFSIMQPTLFGANAFIFSGRVIPPVPMDE